MTVGAIVFARMGSSRLPGKALLPVGARPLVGRVLDRAARVQRAAAVVLATSTDPSDDALADFARSEGVPVHRGALDNVTARAFACARAQGWTAFARICGDRPFFDPGDTDRAIAAFIEAGEPVDLVSSTLAGAVAPGLTTEVVRTEALQRVLALTADPRDLEHVTRFLYAHPDRFRLAGISIAGTGERLRLVVDTEDDLRRARSIVSELLEPAAASFHEIAALARAWDSHVGEACDV